MSWVRCFNVIMLRQERSVLVNIMRKEKIITLYPTIIKPGLAISHYMPPDPVIFINQYPASCSFYLTSLMYFEAGRRYTTELDVLFDGISVLTDEKQDDNLMESFMFSHIDEDSTLVGSSLLVRKVNLERPGVYDINFKVYEDLDGKLSDALDEKSCSFIAATPMRT